MATDAGKGEHHVYKIIPKDSTDQAKLTARSHYLGIDAVAWFANKASSFWSDRMASGTIDIKLSGGIEHYQAALGTFDLKDGARTAPVFQRPVLPDRNYRGGPITLTASLTAIKKDTVVASMLKSAANASLGIIAGMVETASISGPAKLLSAAGEDLIGGVKKLLTDTAEKREPLFDFAGLELTLQPSEIVGSVVYILLHRGALLDENSLEVRRHSQLLLPFHMNAPLDDGAWLLLALRRSDEYSGVREWQDAVRDLRGKIRDLVNDASAGFVSKEEALARLQPSVSGGATLFDEFARLRTIITNDGVLTEREAGFQIGVLWTMLTSARDSLKASDKNIFEDALERVKVSFTEGRSPGGRVAKTFEAQVAALASARRPFVLAENGKRVATLAGQDLFHSMQYLSRSLADLDA